MIDLSVTLGRLHLQNPILVASGTFGYAREMAGIVDFARLGGIIPKTVTRQPRAGNPPPRTVETPSGMLNAIGLDNDGIEHFIAASSALSAHAADRHYRQHRRQERGRVRRHGRPCSAANRAWPALELNLSCPNVAGGVDFATDPGGDAPRRPAGARGLSAAAHRQADAERDRTSCRSPRPPRRRERTPCRWSTPSSAWPIDWRRRRPILGNVTGGLSGPAIKPLALRMVWQVARQVRVPIIGIGGIATIDDVMEFLVAGASAVQLGTVNFYDPTASLRIVEQLPEALANLGAASVAEIVGTLQI